MSEDEKRKLFIRCEICQQPGASEIKGGFFLGERKIWFICKKCQPLIKDDRTNS